MMLRLIQMNNADWAPLKLILDGKTLEPFGYLNRLAYNVQVHLQSSPEPKCTFLWEADPGEEIKIDEAKLFECNWRFIELKQLNQYLKSIGKSPRGFERS